MNVNADGVTTIFRASFSKMDELHLLDLGVCSSSENQFLSRDFFFLLQACVLFAAEMILNKLLILSADTDMLGLSPFDVLYYLSELPVAHVLASSSLFNYLKPNFCTTSKRCGSLKVKCLLFTRT